MQGPDAGGWKRELGSFLILGLLLLMVTVILLLPGKKAPGFLLAAFATVAIPAGRLAWGVYRRYRPERSVAERPPEGPHATE